MKPKDILGLIIRICGLALMMWGIYGMFYAVVESMGLAPVARYPSTEHLVFGLVYILVGYVIVRKVECIENFCYRSDKKPD